MKTINKIVEKALVPIIALGIAGCGNGRDTGKSAVQNRQNYASYATTIREGDNLSFYLGKEGYPINLDSYTKIVKDLNKYNKKAFVNYDGGQIREGKKIILPDLNSDGKVAGRTS
jgi:hypothetical protein